MKDYTTISRIYFIGIGGIGMSALARYYLAKNASVSGYDKTITVLTRQMESEGIQIHYEDKVDELDKEAELIVYTPAVPKDHKELNYYLDNNYEVIKRSALLGEITKSSFNICIAGTHGKTTISTMVAHLLTHSGFGCNAFLGGISVNYNTNFLGGDHRVSVVEADEYDRSFLQLCPDVALISAMDADHLDIYGTKENMEEAFIEFAGRLKMDGLLLTSYDLPKKDFTAANHLRYSLQDHMADAFAANISISYGGYQFDIVTKNWTLEKIQLNMGGMHNIENAVGAIVIAHNLGIDNEKIKDAVTDFKGVKRRFEYIINPLQNDGVKSRIVFIDDYAHHPQELTALISGAKSLFSDRKCTIVFQPHLFSRTKDFAKDFAESLDQADEILILPIYPARELPVEGVTSNLILEEMKNKNARVVTKQELMKYIQEKYPATINKGTGGDVFITAGAGDIDQLVQPISEILINYIL
ncbi:MAG: UDP-N-acetylmuramate--L-alanine ligase [Ginsengibacter sp.]